MKNTPPLDLIDLSPKKRVHSVLVDNLFVFAMLLVLIGHSDVVDAYREMWLYRWVNIFHMPLFFCVSGYLFALTGSARLGTRQFFRKKVVRLLIPLAVITTIGFLLKASLGALAARPVEFDLVSYIHCFLYPHDNPVLFLWFLAVLFEIQIFMFVVCRGLCKVPQYIWGLIPICFVAFYLLPTIEILDISQMIYYISFFVCGMLFHRYESKTVRALSLNSVSALIFLGILSIASPYMAKLLSVYFAPLWAFVGIFFSISLMLNLQKKNIMVFPGLRKYTYTIYLLSWFPQSFFRTVLMSHVDTTYWPLYTVLSFALAVIIPYSIGVFVSRYASRGVIGRFVRISIGIS